MYYLAIFDNKKNQSAFLNIYKGLINNILPMKKNISLTITISPSAHKKLQTIADGYPMPTLMRLILEACAEHEGGLYSLLAKIGKRQN